MRLPGRAILRIGVLLILSVGALLLGACATPAPSDSVNDSESRQVTPAEFLAFIDKVERSVEAGEPRVLTAVERERVERLCSDLRTMLDGVEQMDALNTNQRSTIFNKSQELWALVSGNREDQVICRRERPVGTNFPQTRCRTVRELRRADREADLFLREIRRPGGP